MKTFSHCVMRGMHRAVSELTLPRLFMLRAHRRANRPA
jgi:hypothetical protein